MMCSTEYNTVSRIIYALFCLRHYVGHFESYLNIKPAERAILALPFHNIRSKLSVPLTFLDFPKMRDWRF